MATNNSCNYSPTQYNTQVGGASGTLVNVAPSATSGIPLVSGGSSANPSFTTAVVAGGGTGATTLTGVLIGNGTSAVTGNAITQHDVLVGGTSNAITSVAPSATSGVPLVSGGASADPSFGTAVVAGGGTGATTLTGVLIGNGTSAVTGNAVTQYDVLVGGSSNAISSVGPGTSGQVLQSGGAAANPAYSTATYPATTTINQLLYSSSANTVGGVTAGNYGVLISSSAGVPSWLANGTTGQLLTATTSGTPSWANAPGGGGNSMLFSSGNAFIGLTGSTSGIVPASTGANTFKFYFPVAGTVSKLYAVVASNASTVDITITLYVNGSSTSLQATITALTTGSFTDLTHSVSVNAGDYFWWQGSEATTGVVQGQVIMNFNG